MNSCLLRTSSARCAAAASTATLLAAALACFAASCCSASASCVVQKSLQQLVVGDAYLRSNLSRNHFDGLVVDVPRQTRKMKLLCFCLQRNASHAEQRLFTDLF